MKTLLIILFALIQSFVFSQNNEVEISISQNGKKVKLKNHQATMDKSPFELYVKFQKSGDYTSIAAIVGSSELMRMELGKEISESNSTLFTNAMAGAGSNFNPDNYIGAEGMSRPTYLSYTTDTTHRYNEVKHKGDWIIGRRNIESLSTNDGWIPFEAWEDSVMYIAVSRVKYNDGKLIELGRDYILLNLNAFEVSLLDVRGKEFNGEPGEWQDGCEGCGNGGGFEFSMNGKQVSYYLPGSDTGSFGEYIQDGNQIIIGKEMTLTISEDGKSISDNKYGTVFTLK